MVRKQPSRLISTISANWSGEVSQDGVSIGPVPPATLTRMSSRSSKRVRAVSIAASTSGALVTSQRASSTVRPSARASAATGSIAARSRPSSMRSAPSRASIKVIAAPMPLAGPVTTATFPANSIPISLSSSRCRWHCDRAPGRWASVS